MKERNSKIDFIKMIATFFVIGIHSIAPALYEYPISSKSWYIIIIYRAIISPAVPLFFICSGALLFDKEKDVNINNIFKKYILRIIIALFFWSSIYEIMRIIYSYLETKMPLKDLIYSGVLNVLQFKHNYHFYFIYLMLLFYLFTPIIKIFLQKAKKEDIKYILAIWMVLGIILPTFMSFPQSKEFDSLNQYMVISMGYSSIGYGLLGYYIKNNLSNKNHYALAFLIGVSLTIIFTYLLCIRDNSVNIVFLGGVSPTVMLIAYGFFGYVLNTDFSIYSLKIVKSISNSSFCIFLVHDIFLKILRFKIIQISQLPDIINLPIYIILVFIPSYIVYLILRNIKYVNRYLI